MLHTAVLSDHVCRCHVSDVITFSPRKRCLSGYLYLRLNYTWINQDRKSVQLPAPTYIDYVMTWVQNLLDDENTFPTKSGTPGLSFPVATLSRERVLASVYQDKTFPLRSRQPSSMFIVNSCASSRTYTTRTTPKFFTCVPNRTSTRSLHTSLRLVVSTNYWTSKTCVAHPAGRPSASERSGSAGEKWAFLNLDVSPEPVPGKQSHKDCRSFSSLGRLERNPRPSRIRSCYLIDPRSRVHTHTHHLLYYPSFPLLHVTSDHSGHS